MMQLYTFARTITLTMAAMIAGLALLLAWFIFRRGILNTALWMIALGAVLIGIVNKVSYG